jgi:signal transduction histidine kinase
MRAKLRACFFAGVVLAFISLAVSWLAPGYLARNYDTKSLERLKGQSRRIKSEFGSVMAGHARILGRLEKLPPSASAGESGLFTMLRGLGLDPQTEGTAFYRSDGKLALWLGNVVDLEDHVPWEDFSGLAGKAVPFVIRDKVSIYLISVVPTPDEGYLVLFRLLAFIPRFQSSYVKETHFLPSGLMKRCDIDYWSFQEDVSGFERIFSRSDDEFAGQPRQQNEIQTLYFPLRGQDRRILATVTLSSPSLTERVTGVRESLLFLFYAFLIASLICLFSGLLRPLSVPGRGRDGAFVLAVAVLAGLRALFLPFSRLDRVQALSVFSPSGAGFFSIDGLTRSPADIFLSALAVFMIVLTTGLRLGFLGRDRKSSAARFPALAAAAAGVSAALVLAAGFQSIAGRLVSNANVSLLRFVAGPEFILLHLSLLLFLAAVLGASYLVLRAAVLHSSGTGIAVFFAILAPALALASLAAPEKFSAGVLVLRAAVLTLLILVAQRPRRIGRKEFAGLAAIAATIFLVHTVDRASEARTRSLLENVLRRSVLSQEQWGNFFMRESLPEVDKRGDSIVSFLKEPGSPEFAHALWEKTLAARMNWYSSLELLDAEGNTLSRFSLNIPKLYGQGLSLAPARGWTVSRVTVTSMGRERDFLVGYRDWFDGTTRLGRTIMFLSLDPGMLPFLYSANPYFEILRATPIPSLNNVDFGLLLLDARGRFLFNPQKVASGIPADILSRLRSSGTPFWSEFRDRSATKIGYFFRNGNRFFCLFTSKKTPRNYAVAFIKLFFLDVLLALILALPAIIHFRKKSLRGLFWSFSNRVYASFFAVALVPLLLFTLFTSGLFDRMFMARFTEEAAARASFAKSILEDFLYFQEGDKAVPQAPPEDLVLWVGATLSNDVSLYRDSKLLSSSRREFFDSGLLPDLIDGEIAFRILHERAPYFTQRKRIGGYDFQTLTVPYDHGGSVFLISMPFPFEKQETSRATGELMEFFYFLSLFFAILVFLFARGVRAMIVVPVRKLLAGTREVSLGNLEVAIDHPSRDEMKTLVDGFNAMVASLKAHQLELAEMGKKVAWTEMARKVAHEIKNPLTPIQLSAEHILKVFEDRGGDFEKTLRESISYIIGEVENLRKISQEFMEIARDTSLRMEEDDLKRILQELAEPYRRLLSSRIRFREEYEGKDFRCPVDAAKIRIALRNILANAVEAIRDRGEIVLRLRRFEDTMTITFRDSGQGMAKEVLDRMFEPYFSTKEAGTGLGLPIARKIIEDHGGTVAASSEPGRGTTVTVILPCGV